MEQFTDGPDETIRMSNSPRRSPQITQGLKSPVRSLHPQLQQTNSAMSHKDPGMRMLDFFDDSSGDEDHTAADPAETAPPLERRGSGTKKRHSHEPAPPIAPLASDCGSKVVKMSSTQDGYQSLSPSVQAAAPDRVHEAANTPSTSFNGSVDELLPSNLHSSPSQFLRSSRIPSGRTPRSSAHTPRSDDRRHSIPATRPSTALGAYAIAHEITLQALMRDEETLDQSLQGIPLAPVQSLDRRSLLPAALSAKDDPRSPKNRKFSSPQNDQGKRVHVVPPPIDMSEAGQRSLPDDLVRTPYPFSPEHVHRKDFGRQQQQQASEPAAAVNTSSESTLILSIRRMHTNSQPRVTTITIPATNDFNAVRHSGIRQKEQHFKALDLDDAELFHQIRLSYHQLIGPLRRLSARSLSRIVVGSRDAAFSGWLHASRNPRELAFKGLEDTFSEDKLMQHFRRPATGKGQYAFVHWAHRLAAPPAAALRTPRPGENADELSESELVRRAEQVEGLEFVIAWSITRILTVLLLVFVLSVASALLWTLLGKNTNAGPISGSDSHAGFRGAGDRVTSGVLMGICVLLLGLTGMGGWLGVSWLLM